MPEINAPKVTCSFCGGGGAMREEKRYGSQMVDEDEMTELTALVGERCPMCQGKGEVFVVGGPAPPFPNLSSMRTGEDGAEIMAAITFSRQGNGIAPD